MRKNRKEYTSDKFSLGMSGPIYNFFCSLGIFNKSFISYKRNIILFVLLTWLPLLILALFGGTAFGGVKIPFIHDIDVHVRFLLVLPLLIYAEVIAHNLIQIIVEQFFKCNIINAEQKAKFQHIINACAQLRDSVWIEIALIVLVYTVGYWISTTYLPIHASSWFAVYQNNFLKFTPAGYWYIYVSLPVFQFILLRWYFRILLWYGFLWQVSRLSLQLNSLHPDRAGGLGFLINSIYALSPFLLAHSVLLSGMIFNRIWNAGASVFDFKIEIISILVLILIIPLIPLLFFMIQMINAKRLGTLDYDVVANRYVNDFRHKWIMQNAKQSGSLLGTADIQSLADLANSFEVSNKMRIIPFNTNSIMTMMILAALPILPLALTILPLEKIVSQIIGMIF